MVDAAQLRLRQRRRLNGGFQKWAREGRPVETGPAPSRPAATFTVREDRKWSAGSVLGAMATLPPARSTPSPGAAYRHRRHGVWPARADREERQRADRRPHRSGDRRLRRQRCAPNSRGRRLRQAQVITYCGGGIAASADALALVMLGHPDVRYDASMSEWSNDASLPMETGDQKLGEFPRKREPGSRTHRLP
jgi:thiosulfate/3-mercaptopyruvate sulfurtransferase